MAGTTFGNVALQPFPNEFSVTKLLNAPRPAHRLATTVELKGTSRVTAQWRRSPRRATNVTKLDISPVIAPKTTKARRVQVEAMAVDPIPNATSVARSDTLRGPAPRQLQEGTAEEEEEEWAARAATPVVALATCLVIAFRGPSATTATELGTFPRIAHNLNDGPATPVALKVTFRVTAPTRAAQPKLMKRGEVFSALNDRSLCLYPSRPHIQA